MGGKGRRVFRDNYKGHMEKPRGAEISRGMWGWLAWGQVVGRKCRQLYLNNNKKKKGKSLFLLIFLFLVQ